MTDKEKAIVMAFTGVCMLTGNKYHIFHEYIENIMGRPIYTHELISLRDEIKEKSGADFIKICESVEQEPCEDCISRQAVLDCFTATKLKKFDFILYAREVIKKLPSVTPQHNRWIQVSERLPSDGKYLVTRGDAIGRPMIAIRYFSKDLFKVNEFDFVDKKGVSGWYEYDSEYGWYIDDQVTAWMPLPEPYKAESEDKE